MTVQLTLGGHAPSARFSPCMRYRYELTRRWDDGPEVCWIMLNPSTADDAKDDPTIRRCINFAKKWGFAGLTVANLFAWRSTQRAVLKTLADPVGPENDAAILAAADRANAVVCAWGIDGVIGGRSEAVMRLLVGRNLFALTANGQPVHPLYQPSDRDPVPLVLDGGENPPSKEPHRGGVKLKFDDKMSEEAVNKTYAGLSAVLARMLKRQVEEAKGS